MTFPLNAYLLALVAAFLASAASLPLWRAWCRHIGLVDDPGERKIHEEPIPLAGGLAVLTGLLAPLLAGWLAVKLELLSAQTIAPLQYGLGKRSAQLGAILAGAIGMVLLGWLDDKHELRAGPKFIGQFFIAALVAVAGVRITLFVPNILFSYVVTILWIVTLINAMNFLDNMNGLCAGLGAIAAAFFAAIAASHGQFLVAMIALLACGALLGFLPFNYPRATAFIGDSGSHLTGFLLAVLAILPHFYSTKHAVKLAVLSPLFILAVPLGDLVCVVWIRWRAGKPFWIGDTNHLSHRLVRRGWSKPGAVALIWIIAIVLGAITFLL